MTDDARTDVSTLGSGPAPEPPVSASTIAKIVYGLHGFAIAILIGVTVWLVYRIGRGWLRMLDRKPMSG